MTVPFQVDNEKLCSIIFTNGDGHFEASTKDTDAATKPTADGSVQHKPKVRVPEETNGVIHMNGVASVPA